VIGLFMLAVGALVVLLQSLATTFARPAVNIEETESGAPLSLPTATGRLYTVVVSTRGPLTPTDVPNFETYKRLYGDRTAQTARYWDGIQSYFKYGGSALTVVRARHGGVIASVNIPGTGGVALHATALGQGTYYNGLNLTFADDGTGKVSVTITHDTDTAFKTETSPAYADEQDLVDWSQKSKVIRFTLGAVAGPPTPVVDLALAGGTDDFAAIVVQDRVNALASFPRSLGPGQEAIAGAVTSDEWLGILASAASHGRDAVLAYPDTEDEATLTTLASLARLNGKHGAAFAGWLAEPGPAGRTKWVSPELAVCGKIGAWDAESKGLGQNKPVAGPRRGLLVGCLGVSQKWDDEDLRTSLNAAGVNLIRQRPNGVTIFGWRSLADPDVEPGWINFGHRRMQVALVAKIDAVLEEFLFEEIDGEGTLFKDIQGAVTSRVVDPYFVAGSLFGATAQEAYRVVCDFSNNDPESIQNREVHVDTTVVESEFAEEIDANLTKNLITQGVNA
jgi:hypothetical protein